jgi:aspartyl/asparaginyl-tRNA synthetase
MIKFIYNRRKHIHNLINDEYYKNLIKLRNSVGLICDEYFQNLGAPKVDLYLITKGVSSPMGKGSDSAPIPLKFSRQNAYLVDSAQFGLEPLVFDSFEMVYCYLPSFRNDDPDDMHLNQFFHCEAEMVGDYEKAMKVAEGLIKFLIRKLLQLYEKKVFHFKTHNFGEMDYILTHEFPQIKFDEAEKLFERHKLEYLIERRHYGRVMTREGELKVVELLTNNKNFVWITHYDRDTVPFYQKPDPENKERVLNADLISPPINGALGGECIGAGQRQNNLEEMIESMKRQGIKNIDSYKWYISLRKNPKYRTTSGFGLGIERFLAWILRLNSIYDAALYPIIKSEKLF